MGLSHWSYAAMLASCLLGTLWLVPAYRLGVLRHPLRLLLAIAAAALPFLVWDWWATATHHWWFDPAQTLPPRVLGLPVEEIAFFVVIPLAGILTHEAVRALRSRRPRAGGEDRRRAPRGRR
ncbi:MAG TPA: lycopene cyclase domain-containing protein [Segeticoccus sp.]|uniref:lycopene cyclase domain-containing protein n=1 Tax=Segeticoccus sp. TaxID=2706531 RepID=UPI002D7E54C1|nr:lycopene cyclase domain-containing protein [Segeticoccus sp.]HET8600288.1 lycopene cyclase domain-containing protein [Segeticoccus sp.]